MKTDREKRVEMSREHFGNTHDVDVIMIAIHHVRKHLKCLRLGHEVTINDFGCWCSGDDPLPDLRSLD